MMMATRRFRSALAVSGITAFLGGCASFSPDAGMSTVQATAAAELGASVDKVDTIEKGAALQTRVNQLRRKSLSADSAVQVALFKNRGLQASFNELGIAEAQMVSASLPPNPRFSISRTTARFELEIERQIVGSIFALATLPARAEIAQERFRNTQSRTAEMVLKLAADTRRQYYRTVAANHIASELQAAREAAATTAELIKRLGESGAVNKLDQARDFVFYAELGAQLAQARVQQRIERERLTRLMGLWGDDTRFSLPGRLPGLPRLRSVRDAEVEALKRRIDLKIARADLDLLAKSLGLAEATRFVSDVDLLAKRTAAKSKTPGVDDAGSPTLEIDRSRSRMLELEIEIPIYDFGQTRVVMAQETYMQAANKLAEKAVNVRSEAREAYQAWRGTYDVTRLYQGRVLPLRQVIQKESLLMYNGMLIDVTQLIADARARTMSRIAAVNALRDFWLADTDFKHALIGGGMAGGGGGSAAAPAGGGDAPGH
ncbi:MAG TPA: TolC family protein [Accumulibacter sp.]|nr:TolC family protein [Accumulibacter sp.]